MKFTKGAYVLFACLVALGACKKAEIDPEELTTNPFDKDYVGEAIFGFVAERTVSYQIDTTTFLKLEVDVQVNTALFPKPTNYIVQYELPSGQTLDVPLADLQDDVFTMTVPVSDTASIQDWGTMDPTVQGTRSVVLRNEVNDERRTDEQRGDR